MGTSTGIFRRMGRIQQIGANRYRSALALSSPTTLVVHNPQIVRSRNPLRIATRPLHVRGFDGVVPTLEASSTPLRGFSSVPTTSSAGKEKDDKREIESDDGPVTRKLRELISGGSVQPDPHQLRASRELDRLYGDLIATTSEADADANADDAQAETTQESSSSGGFWSGLFGGISNNNNDGADDDNNDGISGVTGIYTYGGVGCGKTFLMELFYEALDDDPHWSKNKQIVHYHKFMLNVHQFMHTSKQEQQKHKEGNNETSTPIDGVVDHVLKSGRLLCLDEFQVTDVADAMILKELFWRLWKRGCILVTTSNRPPRNLYLNGLQRDRFLPFVDLLEDKCNVVSLMENETDYRMVISAMDNDRNEKEDEEDKYDEETIKGADGSESVASNPAAATKISKRRARQVYFCGKDQKKVLQKLFYERARGRPTNPSTLETQGRKVKIPLACKAKSICMFSFEDLCQKALGAADYLVIGQHFSTVVVHSVPEMTTNEINWLRRFITFVDSMYEWKVRVLLQTNAGSVEEIFVVEDDKDSYQQDEVFAFDRTRSRLSEMSTTRYLSAPWLGADSTSTATSRLDLEPSLADQWFELVGRNTLAEQQQQQQTNNTSGGESESDDIRCKELFDRLDANQDGVLDKDEIKALMTNAFGYEPVDLVVDEMVASVDTDQNGVIDLDEFRALLAEIRHHGRT